jgi:protein-tyrosine phosphatase
MMMEWRRRRWRCDSFYSPTEQVRKENKKVVVHCEVGMSRSPTIVISYLMKYQNMTLREAYNHVKKRRPIVSPNMGMYGELK